MKVANLVGTSENTCNCGSWLAHWEKFSGQQALVCSVQGCRNFSDVGAHIQTSGGLLGSKWAIVPMCHEHNQAAGQLDIYDDTRMVSANVSETCGSRPPS
ncbi:MAG: hypothetical protein WDA10_08895, partial [Porticoccaceae bacterium]